MRRATATPGRVVLCACLAAAALAGCSRPKPQASEGGLTFEKLADTVGLAQGDPLVSEFEPYRLSDGSMRIRGRLDFPNGTRVQIAIKSPAGGTSLAMAQVTVDNRQFETPPLMGPEGPLPVAKYRFEITSHFTSDWQDPGVLRATNDGRALRGPGITRTGRGGAAFYLVEEMKR
jgi:hypothetical protein